MNLDSDDGQQPARRRVRARCTASRRPTTPRRAAGTSCATPTASRSSRAGGWAPARRSTSRSPAAEQWWREQAKRVLALGVRGHQGRRRRGLLLPATTCASPTAAPAPRPAWALRRCCTGARCSARSTRSTPASGVLFGRPGWTGQQAVGHDLGRRPGRRTSGRCATLVAATLTAAAAGFSNWSHDVGGYLGERLVDALPEGAAAALGPVRLLHAADAGARALRAGGVDLRRARRSTLYRDVRPAARAARALRARGGGHGGALPGCRSSARWLLTDPADARGWAIADAYGYGPSLWVAPVLEDGAREREVDAAARRLDRLLDRRARSPAAARSWRAAPLDRIPVWVRRGALDRHLPGRARRRAGSATRPSASARSRRRCGASRRAAARCARLADGTARALDARRVVGHADRDVACFVR